MKALMMRSLAFHDLQSIDCVLWICAMIVPWVTPGYESTWIWLAYAVGRHVKQ